VNKRRARRRLAAHSASLNQLRGWTIQRATGVGVLCGLAALLVAGLFSLSRDGLLYPYAGLLASTAFCGASILWITAFDMKSRGTSGRMRPIRGFDVAVGLALVAPSIYALSLVWEDLGL
jgi:hypothetical protein